MKWASLRLQTKLVFLFTSISLIPLVATGILVYQRANEALEKQVFSQLTSLREIRGREVESYFQQIRNQISTLSRSEMISRFAEELKTAFYTVGDSVNDAQYQKMKSSLKDYYAGEFFEKLRGNVENVVELRDFLPNNRETIILQSLYLSNNPNPTGEKHKLDNAGDSSSYSELHAAVHPIIRDYLEKFGYYDIFLADPSTGYLFYTVFKEVDYSTSLTSGPYKKTNFAKAFRKAVVAGNAGNRDFVVVEDFEPYDPSYHAPASFTATPIFGKDGEFIAVLLFQMPVDKINNIMTGNRHWRQDGLGNSGETYLVGPDFKMRSESRFLMEDKPAMLKVLKEKGAESVVLNGLDKIGTSIGILPVQSKASEDALKGIQAVEIVEDYRGVSVLSAFRKLEIADLNYAILSEIDKEEAFSSNDELRNIMLVMLLLLLLLVPTISFWIGKRIASPIKALNSFSLLVAQGDLSGNLSSLSSRDEVGNLYRSFGSMIENLKKLVFSINGKVLSTESASEEVKQVSGLVSEQMEDMSSRSDSISASTEQASANMESISDRAGEVSSAIATVASSIEEMNATSNEIAKSCQKESAVAENASAQVKLANEMMEKLSGSAKEIGTILDVIKDIADQTNLLALNATIEAASAGEAGKGFAVVAAEVKALAKQTAQATGNIEKQVKAMRANSSNSQKAMEDIAGVIEEVNNISQTIVSAVEEQSATLTEISNQVGIVTNSSEEVSRNVREAALGLDEISGNVSEYTQAISQVSAGMKNVQKNAEELSDVAGGLKESVGQFKV